MEVTVCSLNGGFWAVPLRDFRGRDGNRGIDRRFASEPPFADPIPASAARANMLNELLSRSFF